MLLISGIRENRCDLTHGEVRSMADYGHYLADFEEGPMPSDLPTGTVTLLFTDIEGSILLLQQVGSAMPMC
jgi:hypothetical protein